MPSRTIAATAVAGLLGLTAGVTGAWLLDDDGMPNVGDSTIAPAILGAPDGTVLAAGLERPTGCDDLAATMEALAEEYGSFGQQRMWASDLGGVGATAGAETAAGGDEGAGFDTAAPASDGGGDTTNVQEVGVDEPDIAERVGPDLVVTGTEGVLRVVDVSGAVPVARGSLAVQDWGGDLGLFAVGEDRVVAIANGEGVVRDLAASSMIRPGGWGTTIVVLVDLSDPARPRELSRLESEGWMVDARAVDGVLRLAVRSEGPQVDVHAGGEFAADRAMDWENATEEDHRRYEAEYQAEYEQRLAEALAQVRPEHWQPHVSVDGRTQPLVGCDRIGFPTSFAGLGTLTVAAIDATGDDLRIDDAEAVVTAGSNLYATADRVVIASTRWDFQPIPEPLPAPEVEPAEPEEPSFEKGEDAPADEEAAASARVLPMAVDMIAPWMGGGTTDLHVFDVEGTRVSHVASGSVDGSLLNQYSMSIHEGVLRTATTAVEDGRSESLVTTFRVEGTDLVELGQVGDLGPDEDIQSVRFMGDTAYVVTFRRTDPLYVVDLADPRSPRTRGELKIEGYSAYLHPLGGGQLLGVGQDADPATGITRGTQVSTFDVVDPTSPSRIDVDVTPGSNSEVEWEPHALTVTEDRLAIVPIEVWDAGPSAGLGALLYRVTGAGELERLGLLNTGTDWLLRPRRTIDLGATLLTVGERGVVAWDRDSFDPVETLRFDAPPAFEGEAQPMQERAGGAAPDFDREG